MEETKKTPALSPVPSNELESARATKPPKVWEYVGPKPAPTIGNLPLNVNLPRLGNTNQTYHADELPQEYIPYVRSTNPATKDWWK